jgi:hypothetical protein
VFAEKNGAAQSLRVEGTSHVRDDGAFPGHLDCHGKVGEKRDDASFVLAFSGEADCG